MPQRKRKHRSKSRQHTQRFRRAKQLRMQERGNRVVSKMQAQSKPPWWQRLSHWPWRYDFFISYHWVSGETYANALADLLKSHKFEVFLDRKELAAGDKLTDTIKRSLRMSQWLIVVATPEAVTRSKYVALEVNEFSRYQRPVVPIVFQDVDGGQRIPKGSLRSILTSRLAIHEKAERLSIGPSDAVGERFIESVQILKRRSLWKRVGAGAGTLLLLSFAAICFLYGQTVVQNLRARYLTESNKSLKAQNGPLALREGISSCDSGRLNDGLLWFVRAIELAEESNDKQLNRLARLNLRGWKEPREDVSIESNAHFEIVSRGRQWRLVHQPLDGDLLLYGVPGDSPARKLSAGKFSHGGFNADSSIAYAYRSGEAVGRKGPLSDSEEENPRKRGMIQFWNVADGTSSLGPIDYNTGSQILFGENGRVIVQAPSNYLEIWDLKSSRSIRTSIPSDPDSPYSSNSLGSILQTYSSGVLQFWDVMSGECINDALMLPSLDEAGFSQDDTVFYGTSGEDVFLWNTSTWNAVCDPLKHPDLEGVIVSPDARRAYTYRRGEVGYRDKEVVFLAGQIRIWNTSTGKQITAISNQRSPLAPVLSPDGNTLAVAAIRLSEPLITENNELEIRLYNARTGALVSGPLRHGSTKAMGFSEDGGVFLARSDQGISLWDSKTGRPICEPLHSIGDARRAGCVFRDVRLSPNREMIVTMSSATALRRTQAYYQQWDTATGIPIGPPWIDLAVTVDDVSGKRGLHGELLGTELFVTPPVSTNRVSFLRSEVELVTGSELTATGRVRELDKDSLAERRRHVTRP